LSHGRVELGIGAGSNWDAIEAMGVRRLDPRDRVKALEEGIYVIRELWDTGKRGGVQFDGTHYQLSGTPRGPKPVHDVGIWVGAFKPLMLQLVGRVADGWLPTIPAIQASDLAAGNAVIDAAAIRAGRDPRAIRRLLNITAIVNALPPEAAAELTRLALTDGISAFIVGGDDPRAFATFASEVVPRVREAVEEARLRGQVAGPAAAIGVGMPAKPAAAPAESERPGPTPTPDETIRFSLRAPWDDATRPRNRFGQTVNITEVGRRAAKQLIDVHNLLRSELSELRSILQQVRDGALLAADARSALNEMTLRQNDWTLGAICTRYCGVVAQHHSVEDMAVFPHLTASEPRLKSVIERLMEEHLVIHDAIQEVDGALVQHMARPADHESVQRAIDYLTDAVLSHLAYEEQELVEPLTRFGFGALAP
jgi:hypothetical protein